MGLNMAMIMAKYTKYKFGKCATVSAADNLPEIRMESVDVCELMSVEKVDVCELQQDWIGECCDRHCCQRTRQIKEKG